MRLPTLDYKSALNLSQTSAMEISMIAGKHSDNIMQLPFPLNFFSDSSPVAFHVSISFDREKLKDRCNCESSSSLLRC